MESFKTLMSRKVAGVPVMLIAVLVVGGLLYMAVRMRPSPDEALAEDGFTDDIPDGDSIGDTDVPVFSATPVIYQPTGMSVAGAPQEDTNELWGRRATEWLIQSGETVNDAQMAIQTYLAGESLSQDQGRIRDKAVAQFGLPPEPFDYGGQKPPKPPGAYKGPFTSQGKPPLTHTVKGKSDDTPEELARGYYGSDRQGFVLLIKSANTTKGDGPYTPGMKIRVPEMHRPRWYKATSANRTLWSIARKNGVDVARIEALNPGVDFPVKVGKRVRVR